MITQIETPLHTPNVIEILIDRCSEQLLRATSDPETFDVDLVGKLQRMLNGFLRSQSLVEKRPQPQSAAVNQAPAPQKSSPAIDEPQPQPSQDESEVPLPDASPETDPQPEAPQTPTLSDVVEIAPNVTCVLVENPPPPGHPALMPLRKAAPAPALPVPPRKKPKPTPGAFGSSKNRKRPSKSERRLLKRAQRCRPPKPNSSVKGLASPNQSFV